MFKIKLISKGAEGNLYLDSDRGVIIKDRVAKGYRVKEFDENVRKLRTRKEAKMLKDAARVGVPVPSVVSKTDFVLEIEYIDGQKIKDYIDEKNYKDLCDQIGRSIGKLHKNYMVHGDLTTSNMIFCDGKVYFIDFGLGMHSKKVEDMAVDLHLLEQAIGSTHFSISDKMMKAIFKAYCKEFEGSSEILERLAVIRTRGRYNIRKADKLK